MTTPRNTSLPCSLLFIGLSFSLLALGAIPVAAQRTPPRDPAEPLQGKPQPKRLPRPAGGVARAQVDEKSMRALIRQLVACGTRLTLSSWTDSKRGIGCARDSIAARFQEMAKDSNGKLQVVVKDLTRPNGLAFSPDEKTFYVANSDEKHKVWMRYDVAADGTASKGKVFADVTAEKEDGLPDGMKVDSQGDVYGSGPGGVWVFSPDGKHLGTIKPPETPANCGWAENGKTLYITARTSVYRIKLAVAGEKPLYQ